MNKIYKRFHQMPGLTFLMYFSEFSQIFEIQ